MQARCRLNMSPLLKHLFKTNCPPWILKHFALLKLLYSALMTWVRPSSMLNLHLTRRRLRNYWLKKMVIHDGLMFISQFTFCPCFIFHRLPVTTKWCDQTKQTVGYHGDTEKTVFVLAAECWRSSWMISPSAVTKLYWRLWHMPTIRC